MGSRWLSSCCVVGYDFLDLFNIGRNIIVQFPQALPLYA